ncbi:hypothetical protein V6N13_027280 [Hibiscus sabdariffa]
MLMENFLRSKEYWKVVYEGIEEPTNGTTVTEAQRKELEGLGLKDLKAKTIFFKPLKVQSWKSSFAKTRPNIFGILLRRNIKVLLGQRGSSFKHFIWSLKHYE